MDGVKNTYKSIDTSLTQFSTNVDTKVGDGIAAAKSYRDYSTAQQTPAPRPRLGGWFAAPPPAPPKPPTQGQTLDAMQWMLTGHADGGRAASPTVAARTARAAAAACAMAVGSVRRRRHGGQYRMDQYLVVFLKARSLSYFNSFLLIRN